MLDATTLFFREHPFYAAQKDCWRRSLAAYGGGKSYIREALTRHMSEIAPEYEERLKRAYYINYPRRIAQLITQYVLSVRPERRNADPELVEDWNRRGLRVDEVMRQFSTHLTLTGCAWLAVDMPSFDGVKTKADERIERLRPYATALGPLSVPDWHYEQDGRLGWVLAAEKIYDNSNPLETPVVIDVRKLWTRDEVRILTRSSDGTTTDRTIRHGLGEVPFVRSVETDGYGIGENHWFEDVVRISDAILNNESEAQMNAVKQMFGLLVLPEDFLDVRRETRASEEKGEPLSHVIARSAAVYESVEGKGTSRYIAPSGVETTTIRTENQALRKELYEIVGLAAGKETRLVESAEAKSWDFQNIERFLATRADALEQCEAQAWRLFAKWNPAFSEPAISYNRNFSVLDLKESIAALLELSGFNPESDEYQREIGKTAAQLLNRLRQMPQETQEAIRREIEASSPACESEQGENPTQT